MLEAVWRAVLPTFGTVLLLAAPAFGAAPRVRLTIDECDRLDEPSVQRIFAADLGASVTAEYGPDVTEVSIECEGPRVIVRVRDPISRKSLRRSFDSTSFGERGESRLIAIAASELVLASWAELSHNPAPEVEPEGPKPSVESLTTARASVRAHQKPTEIPTPGRAPPVAEPPSAAELPPPDPPGPLVRGTEPTPAREVPARVTRRLLAVVSARSFFKKYGALVGGGLRIGEDHVASASWAADLLIESGRVHNYATSTSFGAHIFAHKQGGSLTCRLGFGVRMGALSYPQRTTVATWGWPVGAASCSMTTRPIVFELSGESGYSALLSPESSRATLRAGWFAGNLGIGLTL
jgi:hypothetical protein